MDNAYENQKLAEQRCDAAVKSVTTPTLRETLARRTEELKKEIARLERLRDSMPAEVLNLPVHELRSLLY